MRLYEVFRPIQEDIGSVSDLLQDPEIARVAYMAGMTILGGLSQTAFRFWAKYQASAQRMPFLKFLTASDKERLMSDFWSCLESIERRYKGFAQDNPKLAARMNGEMQIVLDRLSTRYGIPLDAAVQMAFDAFHTMADHQNQQIDHKSPQGT